MNYLNISSIKAQYSSVNQELENLALSKCLPDEKIRVGYLHQQTRLGRHTTSTARLYSYKGAGSIIDSPGIRDFGWNKSHEPMLNMVLSIFVSSQPIAASEIVDTNRNQVVRLPTLFKTVSFLSVGLSHFTEF